AGAGQPFFSPDGQSIGFWQDGRLRKLSLSGGAVVTICEVPSVEGATWGVGDEIVFAASGPLYRVSAAGGKPEVFAAPDTAGGQAYRWPEFLPDGRTVLLMLVDRAGHAQTLPAPLERYRAPRFSPDGRRIAVAIEHGAGGIFSADIWVYELGARNLSRLTFDSVNMFPEWARDGRQVAFVRQLGAITREGLFRIAADGSGVAETLLVRP